MQKFMMMFFIMCSLSSLLSSETIEEEGKRVFETYCWGCHHQTAMAFGPSFTRIASIRNSDEIRAMITDPVSVSKALGYRRNAMPILTLNARELEAITHYILSFKEAK